GALAEKFDSSIDPTKAAILGGAIGTGVGLIAGAMMYEGRMDEQKKLPPIRRAAYVDPEATAEIDAAYKEVQESTKWGRSETETWDARYWDDSDDEDLPYQGYQAR